jgi:hypothetical protein
MDGRKDALNDAALEREIETLLAVEPSRDFVARVRSRVAEEPAPSRWGWRWPLAGVATSMALIVVGVALWRPLEPEPRSTSAPAQHATAPDVSSSAPVAPHDEPVAVARAQRQPARAVAGPPRTIEISLPPVIIAENEIRAFAALTANTRARFEVAPPAVADREAFVVVKRMQAMEPVTVDPIEIEPLVEAATLE